MSQTNIDKDKVYKGNEVPSDSLFESTIELVKNMCKTNNQTYIFRNIVELMNKGFESNLRSMLFMLMQNGNNTRLIVKDDKTVLEYQKEYGIPASNIGYALTPIANGIFKNKVNVEDITLFQEKSAMLLENLKETESLAIEIIVKNNISTEALPLYLKSFIDKKKEQILKDIKQQKDKELQNKRKQEKREKNKLRQEKRNLALKGLLEGDLNFNSKTKEEWLSFAKKNGLRLSASSETKEEIFNSIIQIASKILGTTNTIIKHKKEDLKSKESKTKEEWIEYARVNKVDLAGATLKDDIYDLIKLDYEEKLK